MPTESRLKSHVHINQYIALDIACTFCTQNHVHRMNALSVECSSRIAQLKPIIIITMDTPNILGYRIVLL